MPTVNGIGNLMDICRAYYWIQVLTGFYSLEGIPGRFFFAWGGL